MGVSDNMLHKETSKVAGSSHLEERLRKVPAENGHFAATPKYKQCKVPVIRDFPPGCGRFAAAVTRPKEKPRWPIVSESKNPALSVLANKIECERSFAGDSGPATHLVNGISGLQQDLAQENVSASKEEAVLPGGVVNGISGLQQDLAQENVSTSKEEAVPPGGLVNGISGLQQDLAQEIVSTSKEEADPPGGLLNGISGLLQDLAQENFSTSKEEAIAPGGLVNGVSGLHQDLAQEIVSTSKEEAVPPGGLLNGISGLQQDLARENVSTSKPVPSGCRNLHSDGISLEKTPARNYRPRRGVTVIRDFPPFCGRNAPPLNQEERIKWLASLQNKAINLEKFVKEENPPEKTICTDMKQVIDDIQVENAQESKLESAAPTPPAEIQSKPYEPASGKRRKQDACEASSRDLKEDMAGMEERRTKSWGETFSNEFDSKYKTVTETTGGCTRGLEESSIRDMVVDQEDQSSEKMFSDSYASEDLLLEEDCVSQEVLGDRSIVQSPMASSTSPLQRGKVTCKRDLAGGSFKKKRKNEFILLPRANSYLVANKNDAESLAETCTKKNFCPSRGAYQGICKVSTWSNEDSLQLDGQQSAQTSSSCDVNLTPRLASSTNHNNDATNTRSKVRETLRLFQVICRKLLQEEESKLIGEGKTRKRVDLQAAKILKERGKFVNTGDKFIGTVPGVEVGDEFQYFVELNIVGLHRQSQAGIDYVKHGKDVIATSVIASGVYEDDLEYSDVLVYMGQGGNLMQKGKEPEDQKLERGNLALANSIFAKNPVRVILGQTRSSDASDSRGKTYVYDGLYVVEDYKQERGPHGKLVFKFKLVRRPGQPELAWKVVKKSSKSRAREGLCVHDISQGKEKIPICAINTIDSELPPPFEYVAHMIYPDWCRPIPPKGCDCINGCLESRNCSCVMKNVGEIPYNHNGAIVEAKPLVYECGPTCKCPPSCYNRVSQHGIKFQLEIFKTESRGWGVRSLISIPSGSFICEYAGELLEDREAEKRAGNDEYLFDIGNEYKDSSLWDGLSTLMPDAASSSYPVVKDSGFTIDAAKCGNIGRFINHSCSPNLYAQNVLFDHDDMRIPHIMLFAAENIPPLQELTYHYNYMIDQVHDENGNIKKKICYCGSSECTGRLY